MVRQRHVKKETTEKVVNVSEESIDDRSFKFTNVFKFILIFTISLYVLLPIVLVLFPRIIEQAVFLNLYLGSNEQASLATPAIWNLSGVANFHIDNADVTLGVWHVLPKDKMDNYEDGKEITMEMIESNLAMAENVVIYNHGNAMTRASGGHGQRNRLYSLLQSEGYHVIAFDYRGYGDSTGWPSEEGVVSDSIAVFKWVRQKTNKNAKVVLWGHSLGSSVVTLAASKISAECHVLEKGGNDDSFCPGPRGVLLEAPFASVRSGAHDSGLAKLFTKLYPLSVFEYILESGLQASKINLATEDHIALLSCPVMILHAYDDPLIGLSQSEKLFKTCENQGRNKKVHFVKFKASHGYNHMDLYKAPEIPGLLKKLFADHGISNLELIEV